MDFKFTWSADWIQKYESPWGIIEKFKYANAVDGNTVLNLIANDDVRKLKGISNTGRRHRELIHLRGIDYEVSEKILGINLKRYNDYILEQALHPLSINRNKIDNNFHQHINYCSVCLNTGYHSIFHQIKFFDHCLFHPNKKLIGICPKCKKTMPEYCINKGNIDAYNCICGQHFLGSKNIRVIFSTWKNDLSVQSKTVNTWKMLPKDLISTYQLSYPFYNYNNYSKFDKKNLSQHLVKIPELLIAAFTEKTLDNSKVINIYSSDNIFKIRDNHYHLRKNYNEISPHRICNFKSKEMYHIDSIFLEIYKQTRVIYKAISRYILNKVINMHRKCVKKFDDTYEDGPTCLHAYAFMLWKSECEGRRLYPGIINQAQISNVYDFRCLNNKFSVFPKGPFMLHLKEILNTFQRNPSTEEWEFNLLRYNISAISYVVNRITSYLLLERYIKWLEIMHHPKEFKLLYPNPDIPMYLAKIPLERHGKIEFYFPNGRFNYMENLIKEIDNRLTCF
ncbi:hypothetical protein [Bacillus cereus]|uniref:hypothetical protein n=1 Tax=Bacillus cereus TaxID=1396 RepID=UPI000A3015C6|nr:hypothetical protein [Bacillus cereus]QXW42374.1 hypothetical protein KXJ78_27795 [Klebsiella grimontii]MCU4813600.1 hypothetical protein [Bacillus cereus]MCU5141992.1 hypothetical protein [Bacillus cereus]MCU5385018.1 hypothetical protein [Bacillus cereus]SME13826.1 hypothetical protein BACERE00195_03054 [Bacillus cereus]